MKFERIIFNILLLVYIAVGGLFAALTPAWQAPDEPAHYNYVRQMAERRNFCCPKIEPGDWDQAYLSRLTSARFAPVLLVDLDRIQYEDHQPPLYYQLASLVYDLTDNGTLGGNLIPLRLFSVLLGVGVVWCTYALGKTLLPPRPAVALGAAALVAFLPQHVAMLASVNNDSLAELLIGLTLLVMARYVQGDEVGNRRLAFWLLWTGLIGLAVLLVAHRVPLPVAFLFLALVGVGTQSRRLIESGNWQVWLIGILVGLIFATKTTGYFLAAIGPLAVVLRWGIQQDVRDLRAFRQFPARRLLIFLIPALLLGAVWWGHSMRTYGFPDFLGLGAHNAVVADQPRTADRIAVIGIGQYAVDAVQTTFNSFWGQFGWMALPLQGWMYAVFALLSVVSAAGLVVEAVVLSRQSTFRGDQANWYVWLLLWLAVALGVLAYVYYNTEFLQLQGRYLFPVLIPVGLLMAVGLDAWRRWLLPHVVVAQWLPLVVFGLLAPFDLYLLLRVIRPLLLP